MASARLRRACRRECEIRRPMPDPLAEGARESPLTPLPSGGPGALEQNEPTVGTGSVFAIGCTIATLLVIFVGIAVFILLRVL